MIRIVLRLCGAFYALLCVFSIVTGLMYATGNRKLNPLELSDSFMRRYSEPEKLRRFAVKMGWVTFAVGIAQGITALAIFWKRGAGCWWIALGFTVFSIASVVFKLKGKVSTFAVLKSVAYAAILIVLLLPASRALFLK